jgi:hypothetical protein
VVLKNLTSHTEVGVVLESAITMEGRRRGAIHPSHYPIEHRQHRQWRPTHPRCEYACDPTMPIQENRVLNLNEMFNLATNP